MRQRVPARSSLNPQFSDRRCCFSGDGWRDAFGVSAAELVADRPQLPLLEFPDGDPVPPLGGADDGRVHQLQHGALYRDGHGGLRGESKTSLAAGLPRKSVRLERAVSSRCHRVRYELRVGRRRASAPRYRRGDESRNNAHCEAAQAMDADTTHGSPDERAIWRGTDPSVPAVWGRWRRSVRGSHRSSKRMAHAQTAFKGRAWCGG
jgi:hypothetical protein